MIGLLVVTHCDLGRELLNAAEFIVGRIEAADAVAVTETSGSEKLRRTLEEKVSALNGGQGVLILTDMFGGTPSNLSLSFLERDKVEVLTGVNLPMIIAIVHRRGELKLAELAKKAHDAGKMGISLASRLLEAP